MAVGLPARKKEYGKVAAVGKRLPTISDNEFVTLIEPFVLLGFRLWQLYAIIRIFGDLFVSLKANRLTYFSKEQFCGRGLARPRSFCRPNSALAVTCRF